MKNKTKSKLNSIGVRPKKSKGQNFLTNEKAARWLVLAGVLGKEWASKNSIEDFLSSSDDLDIDEWLHAASRFQSIVEIGPGLGALTEIFCGLMAQSAEPNPKFVAIEYDDKLALKLSEKFPSLRIHNKDAGEYDVGEFFAGQPAFVFGNLPYSQGAKIMANFLGTPSPFEKAAFLLQEEVANRLQASPATKAYGSLSVIMQERWKITKLGILPPAFFTPKPKVNSALVLFERCDSPSRAEHGYYGQKSFEQVVKQGFCQRRKQLKKNLLKHDELGWQKICEILGVAETVRAEELGLEKWRLLASLYDHRANSIAQSSEEIFDIVDESDHVIGQRTRDAIHSQRLSHRAVHIFVTNKDGALLLQKRSLFKDIDPGKWGSSASGHVEAGDTYTATAIREIEEELGIKTNDLQFIQHFQPSEANGSEHVDLFLLQLDQNRIAKKIDLNPAEVAGVRFFQLEHIDLWLSTCPEDLCSGFVECYEYYRANYS